MVERRDSCGIWFWVVALPTQQIANDVAEENRLSLGGEWRSALYERVEDEE